MKLKGRQDNGKIIFLTIDQDFKTKRKEQTLANFLYLTSQKRRASLTIFTFSMKGSLFLGLALLFMTTVRGSGIQSMPIPPAQPGPLDSLNAQQLLIVLTDGWNNLQAICYGFQKDRGEWLLKFRHPVVVGRNGLGIGEGIVPLPIQGAPLKKEGDLKSPAGIFTIGTAFGYAEPQQAGWIKNPYVRATDTLICIDDVGSSKYNQLVNNDPAKSDWKSFEYMHRKDDFYKWGLFINHNAPRTEAGKGSCIFMHIWESDHQGTDGCTAMKEDDILEILHWINSDLNPMLVQLPKKEYGQLWLQLKLPKIDFSE
jgi:L,D-peptidoglycan transpeptidase YkuD (ErfK/YbiS/YcfS/YnhG family)